MKKVTALALVAALLLAFTACNEDDGKPESESSGSKTTTDNTESTTDNTDVQFC